MKINRFTVQLLGRTPRELRRAMNLPERGNPVPSGVLLFSWNNDVHTSFGPGPVDVDRDAFARGSDDEDTAVTAVPLISRAAEDVPTVFVPLSRTPSRLWVSLTERLNAMEEDEPIEEGEAINIIIELFWRHDAGAKPENQSWQGFSRFYQQEDAAEMPSPIAQLEGAGRLLYPGVWAVVAGTGQGKSTLVSGRRDGVGAAHSLSALLRAPVINYGEPTPRQHAFTMAGLVSVLGRQLNDHDVVIVDSAKQLLLSSNSNLGKGGLSLAFQREMSFLSSALAYVGKTVIFTVNPLGLDDESSRAFINALEGVAETIMVPTRLSGADTVGVSVRSRTGAARGQQNAWNVQVRDGWLVTP